LIHGHSARPNVPVIREAGPAPAFRVFTGTVSIGIVAIDASSAAASSHRLARRFP
jgi:hypothetical protein